MATATQKRKPRSIYKRTYVRITMLSGKSGIVEFDDPRREFVKAFNKLRGSERAEPMPFGWFPTGEEAKQVLAERKAVNA